jgi:hypothetical protein
MQELTELKDMPKINELSPNTTSNTFDPLLGISVVSSQAPTKIENHNRPSGLVLSGHLSAVSSNALN